ncbi:hypothetical protein FQA47_021427 [Oryzias melastigma]|uniref:Uncharacterized protein n=1 Tax=Oryzias melastigma TaxID=30732 RepID=A0A834C1J1_ORYME|nr:hypothetical protein FQA47_021427 [Oryzias melastigma]
MDSHQHRQRLFFLLPPGTIKSGRNRGSPSARGVPLPPRYGRCRSVGFVCPGLHVGHSWC